VALGYRFPKRWGLLSVEVRNLFDQDFQYQDDSFRVSEFTKTQYSSRFIPDRVFLMSAKFDF
jgi:outer membrane receptor for ferrienterochelin and colicin